MLAFESFLLQKKFQESTHQQKVVVAVVVAVQNKYPTMPRDKMRTSILTCILTYGGWKFYAALERQTQIQLFEFVIIGTFLMAPIWLGTLSRRVQHLRLRMDRIATALEDIAEDVDRVTVHHKQEDKASGNVQRRYAIQTVNLLE